MTHKRKTFISKERKDKDLDLLLQLEGVGVVLRMMEMMVVVVMLDNPRMVLALLPIMAIIMSEILTLVRMKLVHYPLTCVLGLVSASLL